MLPQSERAASRIERYLASLSGDVEKMTPSKINGILDHLDALGSILCNVFIAEGRGNELPSETFRLSDPLAILYQRLSDTSGLLRTEISRRYGPNAPSRLPLRKR